MGGDYDRATCSSAPSRASVAVFQTLILPSTRRCPKHASSGVWDSLVVQLSTLATTPEAARRRTAAERRGVLPYLPAEFLVARGCVAFCGGRLRSAAVEQAPQVRLFWGLVSGRNVAVRWGRTRPPETWRGCLLGVVVVGRGHTDREA